ncbi:hypothetical protein PSV08DRAFT_357766 [Bipolaris maydis]|uniref:uncharacterized protein n=1 Tax=Cochliobolus heterostrophus TaxID=5016 RepID=UPI0024DBBDDF|nr:hypothetical protein J3E73DRAFT_348616 [Bipolaris maydis]KAJ6275467.1 hypothetical protein PSV08DRAFT_357766 [Bipolaris maydis]
MTSASPSMNFDFSRSDQSMLTWAINIVLAAPDIPSESCIAIKSKLSSISDAHRTAADVKTIQNIALNTVRQTGAWQLWNRIRKPLSSWEHAYKNTQRNCSKQHLSRPAREAVQHANTSFDIAMLPSEQLDFLFLLAYAEIGPCSFENFMALYKKCSRHSNTGAEVRNQVEKYLAKDKVLQRLQRSPDHTGKKREAEEMYTVIEKEENEKYPMKKRHRQAQPQPLIPPTMYDDRISYVVPHNTDFLGDTSTAFNQIWSKEEIDSIPCTEYRSVYDLQANTIAMSCPDATWIVHSTR